MEALDDPFSLEEYDFEHSVPGEDRFTVIGATGKKVVVFVVYTPRNGRSRIISARYATLNERRKYYERLRKIYS
jgi:uncharacterized DUF497 family protein